MKKEYLYAGTSIFVWSTIATATKLLLANLNSMQITLVSSLFAALLLLVVTVANGKIREVKNYKVSVKEFNILFKFLSYPKRTFTRTQLMDEFWGYDSETEQNVVWVYVSYLRRKLAKIGSCVVIEAHRNLGYSLEAGK